MGASQLISDMSVSVVEHQSLAAMRPTKFPETGHRLYAWSRLMREASRELRERSMSAARLSIALSERVAAAADEFATELDRVERSLDALIAGSGSAVKVACDQVR
jgi:hypothetical protein